MVKMLAAILCMLSLALIPPQTSGKLQKMETHKILVILFDLKDY